MLKRDNLITQQAEQIQNLRSALDKKIEEFVVLKHELVNLFFPYDDIREFDKNFSEFKNKYPKMLDKAKKYEYLLKAGVIKDEGNTISAIGQFYISYGK